MELTAFVREVVLPGGPGTVPRLDPGCCNFRLRYAASPIHRWGIFASETIPARRRVIRYTGERINVREARRRSVRQHLYLFWTSPRFAIDGAIGGSGAEFVNHSCEPNLRAHIARGRIHLVSLRRIAAGEELTLDYHLAADSPEVRCLCGSPRCRGVLNRTEHACDQQQTAAGRSHE
ncbi:MAG TPA: SET domain-containing protein-lysine N-methyltransferase [Povalibacter sp.]|nr:SET domain-containing protein-lysine N-methyltransferase [Povalibacter sp.]